MMTIDNLLICINAANRFIETASDAIDRLKQETAANCPAAGTKETPPVRRASLDLTRALANLRMRSS